MLIEFQTFADESHRVMVNPSRVVAITERENQLMDRFFQKTLLIEMDTGSKVEVYDHNRDGITRLKEAFFPNA